MAIRDFYSDVDLKANQLFNSRLHNVTTAARIILGATLGLSDKGYQVYDTDLSSPYYWDGTAWVTSASPLPILTAGSVVFSNGLTLAEDNANFYWDDVNKLLGIGTSFPSYPLDVVGVINGSSDARFNGLTIGRGGGNFPSNTALGANTLVFNSTGVSNVAVGATSMVNNTIGQQNTSVGHISLASNTQGNYNTAVGFWAMRDNTLGNFNTSLGISSGRSTTTGSNNITIGYLSGNGITTGSENTIIGRASGLSSSLSNTVIIADGAGSYRFYSPSTGNILFGSTTDSGQKLQVTGTAIISGTTTLTSLSGVGSRMVVADAVGELSTAAIPVGTVTSVGLSMPTAFTVTNSPVTGAGTLTVTGAGTASQYVRGDGALAVFPNSPSGGGSSVGFYLNGSVAASVAGYEQLSRDPVFGLGTNYTTSTDGLIAQFLTDVGDPAFLNIPGGAWLVDLYFSADSPGGDPDFYVELYKYDGTTFTLLSTNVATPEVITNGTAIDLYITSLSVPTTTLTLTDRLAIRVFVDCNGKTLTLYTEGDNLSEVVTTFSAGIATLNGLVAQVQNFAVGTTGTDFNISSLTDTHTFNLPTASATNRGALSSADWTTFDGKQNALTNPVTGTGTNNEIAYFNTTGSTISSLPTATYPSLTELSYVKGVTSSIQTQINNKFTLPSLTSGSVLFSNGTTIAQDNSNFFWDDTNNRLGIGTSAPADPIHIIRQIGSQAIIRLQTLDNTNNDGYSGLNAYDNSGNLAFSFAYGNPGSFLPNTTIIGPRNATGTLSLVTTAAATTQMRMFANGNFLYKTGGTFTDTGQKLQVTGTAIISSTTTLSSLSGTGSRMVVANATGVLSTTAIPSFTITASAIGGTPNAEGITISGTNLTLAPADENFGGVVTTGSQSFNGKKYFWNSIYVVDSGGIPTVSITNTGITFENSAAGTGTINATNITGIQSLELPDGTGTFALSVNSVAADASGGITLTASSVGAEPALGNPSVSGYVLSSTTAGVRSWVTAGGGGASALFNYYNFR